MDLTLTILIEISLILLLVLASLMISLGRRRGTFRRRERKPEIVRERVVERIVPKVIYIPLEKHVEKKSEIEEEPMEEKLYEQIEEYDPVVGREIILAEDEEKRDRIEKRKREQQKKKVEIPEYRVNKTVIRKQIYAPLKKSKNMEKEIIESEKIDIPEYRAEKRDEEERELRSTDILRKYVPPKSKNTKKTRNIENPEYKVTKIEESTTGEEEPINMIELDSDEDDLENKEGVTETLDEIDEEEDESTTTNEDEDLYKSAFQLDREENEK